MMIRKGVLTPGTLLVGNVGGTGTTAPHPAGRACPRDEHHRSLTRNGLRLSGTDGEADGFTPG
jgi:hypothetical protein